MLIITISLEIIYFKEFSNHMRLEYLNPWPAIRTQYLSQGNSSVCGREGVYGKFYSG